MAPVTLTLDGALVERLAAALERLEALLPMAPASPDWEDVYKRQPCALFEP